MTELTTCFVGHVADTVFSPGVECGQPGTSLPGPSMANAPQVTDTADSWINFQVSLTSSSAATLYYALVGDDAPVPTPQKLVAGLDGSNNAITVANDSKPCAGSCVFTVNITSNINAGATYGIFFVAESAGVLQPYVSTLIAKASFAIPTVALSSSLLFSLMATVLAALSFLD